jgi:hypothetical protein
VATEPNPDNPTVKLEFDGDDGVTSVILEFHFSDNFDEDVIRPFVNGVSGVLLRQLA